MTAAATTAVIMARGLGTRMRRAQDGVALAPAQQAAAVLGQKGMIPDTRGRPFLAHLLSALADAGVRDVVLVVAPDHDLLREHFAAHPPRRVTLRFAIQPEATGTADAVLAAAPFVDGPFLVCNADNLYPVEAIAPLVTAAGMAAAAFDREALVAGGNIDAARIAAFAALTVDRDGFLTGIVEKPGAPDAAPPAAWVGMNLWRFDAAIFPACRDVAVSVRGERELPQAVALALTRGARIAALPVHAGVLDLSSRGDIAAVAARLGPREATP